MQMHRPVVGTRGCCEESNVRFYTARSRPAEASNRCFAISERLHQFALLDGISGTADAGSHCARFCAAWLSRLVAHAFREQVHSEPLVSSRRDEVAAISAWVDALSAGFVQCDRLVAQEVDGSCGALLCSICRSGIYVASVGRGRVAIGTKDDDGRTVWCDEASNPHCIENEAEAERWGYPPAPSGLTTRFLGGSTLKQSEPRLIAIPDVVRQEHEDCQRFVILGSPEVWASGPRLPMQWAVEAHQAGRNPADEVVVRSQGVDVVAVVLVLPPGLGSDDSPLPQHDELTSSTTLHNS